MAMFQTFIAIGLLMLSAGGLAMVVGAYQAITSRRFHLLLTGLALALIGWGLLLWVHHANAAV
jgi:hypothetical protein